MINRSVCDYAQEESEQNDVDGMKKGDDSTGDAYLNKKPSCR